MTQDTAPAKKTRRSRPVTAIHPIQTEFHPWAYQWKLTPGSSRCACSQCGDGFNSVHAFDAHQILARDGSVICLSEGELLARGWSRLDDGWWVTKRRAMDG